MSVALWVNLLSDLSARAFAFISTASTSGATVSNVTPAPSPTSAPTQIVIANPWLWGLLLLVVGVVLCACAALGVVQWMLHRSKLADSPMVQDKQNDIADRLLSAFEQSHLETQAVSQKLELVARQLSGIAEQIAALLPALMIISAPNRPPSAIPALSVTSSVSTIPAVPPPPAPDVPTSLDDWMELIRIGLRSSELPYPPLTSAVAGTSDSHIVSFADVTLYQQDHTYATFADKARASCLLVPIPAHEDEYAAFPYPRSAVWFESERAALGKIFICKGSCLSPRPLATLQQYAVLKRIENPTGLAPWFAIQQQGILYLKD